MKPKSVKTYLIKFNDMLVPQGEGAVSVIQPIEILEVRGTTVEIYSGMLGDFLHIRDDAGAVVFSAESHLIKYCKIKSVQHQLKSIKPRGVKLNEQAVHLPGQANVLEGANKDV